MRVVGLSLKWCGHDSVWFCTRNCESTVWQWGLRDVHARALHCCKLLLWSRPAVRLSHMIHWKPACAVQQDVLRPLQEQAYLDVEPRRHTISTLPEVENGTVNVNKCR